MRDFFLYFYSFSGSIDASFLAMSFCIVGSFMFTWYPAVYRHLPLYLYLGNVIYFLFWYNNLYQFIIIHNNLKVHHIRWHHRFYGVNISWGTFFFQHTEIASLLFRAVSHFTEVCLWFLYCSYFLLPHTR